MDESRDEFRDLGGEAPSALLFERYRDFAVLTARLEADEKDFGKEIHFQELEALCEQRSQLARELVDTPAPTIPDVIFKMTIVSSLVAEGEVRLGLTQQCIEECERALAVETGAEQAFKALEPALWRLCLQIRHKLAAAAAEEFEFSEAWSDEICKDVHAVACHQARSPACLRAKGDIFREIWLFAEETDLWSTLQMSYMRDFGALARCTVARRRLGAVTATAT